MEPKIDWPAMKQHVGQIFNTVKLLLEGTDDIGPWAVNVFLEDFPPRIEAVYLRRSGDRRRAEVYGSTSYWEKEPPEDEMILVGEKVARVAEDNELSAKRIWTNDGRLHYSLKPDREQFKYPLGTEE